MKSFQSRLKKNMNEPNIDNDYIASCFIAVVQSAFTVLALLSGSHDNSNAGRIDGA